MEVILFFIAFATAVLIVGVIRAAVQNRKSKPPIRKSAHKKRPPTPRVEVIEPTAVETPSSVSNRKEELKGALQPFKDILSKTRRDFHSLVKSSMIVNFNWTYIVGDQIIGNVLFKPRGNLLLILKDGSASKGKWEILPALEAISMEIDDEVTVMGYELVDPEGAIMLLSANSKIHLFVNDKKLSNPNTIRSVSAALQWFNSTN